MQTFLPYSDFKKSANSMDNKRLNKQIVEVYQILRAINKETKGWQNHPATIMWKGYENALALYGLFCCQEYFIRTLNIHALIRNIGLYHNKHISVEYPWWFGLDQFHKSHRSNLYRKDPIFYKKFEDDTGLPYCWPIIVDNKKILRYKHAGDKKYLKEEIYAN